MSDDTDTGAGRRHRQGAENLETVKRESRIILQRERVVFTSNETLLVKSK
jgi:hypothetical protein